MLQLASSNLSNWHCLVLEASDKIHIQLNAEQESYLVFLLMRYTNRSDWVKNILAISFLESGMSQSVHGFQEVGDQCLLLSGLFPRRARGKNVPISYFVQLGRSAYASIAHHKEHVNAALFNELSIGFINMMDLLLQIRSVHEENLLAPLEALSLYEDTHSRAARAILETHGTLLTPLRRHH